MKILLRFIAFVIAALLFFMLLIVAPWFTIVMTLIVVGLVAFNLSL